MRSALPSACIANISQDNSAQELPKLRKTNWRAQQRQEPKVTRQGTVFSRVRSLNALDSHNATHGASISAPTQRASPFQRRGSPNSTTPVASPAPQLHSKRSVLFQDATSLITSSQQAAPSPTSSYQYARRRDSEQLVNRGGFGRRQTQDFSSTGTPRKALTFTAVKAAMASFESPSPPSKVVVERKSGPTLKNFERGVFGQIQPTGIQSRAQLEATSPWAVAAIAIPNEEVRIGPNLLKKRSGGATGDKTQPSSPQLREVAADIANAVQVAEGNAAEHRQDLEAAEGADQDTEQESATEESSHWLADDESLLRHTASPEQHASLLPQSSYHQRRGSEIEQRYESARTSRDHKQHLEPASVLQKIEVLLIGHRARVECTINTLQKSLAQLAEVSKLSKQLAEFHLDCCQSTTAASSEMDRPNIEDPPSMIRRRTRSVPDVLDLIDSAAKSLGVDLMASSQPPPNTISSTRSERGASTVPSMSDAANALAGFESSTWRNSSRFDTDYQHLASRPPSNEYPYCPPGREDGYGDSDYEAEESSNYSNNAGQRWRPSPPPCYQDLSFEDAIAFPRYNMRHLHIHQGSEEAEAQSQSSPALFSTPPEPGANTPSNESSPPLSPSIPTTLAPIASKPPQHIPFLLHSTSSLDDLQVTKLGRVPDNYLTTGQPRPPPPSNVHTPGMWTPRVPTPPAGTPRLWSPHPTAPAGSPEAIIATIVARKTPSPPPPPPFIQPVNTHARRASSSLPTSPIPGLPSPTIPLPSSAYYQKTSKSEPTTPPECGEGAFVPCRSQTPVPTPAPPSLELRRKMSNHVYSRGRPHTPPQWTARSDSPVDVDGQDDGNTKSEHERQHEHERKDNARMAADDHVLARQNSNEHKQLPITVNEVQNPFDALPTFPDAVPTSLSSVPPHAFVRTAAINPRSVPKQIQSPTEGSSRLLQPGLSLDGMQSPLLLDPAEIPFFLAQLQQDGSMDAAPTAAELDRKSGRAVGMGFGMGRGR